MRSMVDLGDGDDDDDGGVREVIQLTACCLWLMIWRNGAHNFVYINWISLIRRINPLVIEENALFVAGTRER